MLTQKGHDRMGFVVECLLEHNPAPVKEPLCKTKHSCVKRSTSSYWKGDGRRFKQPFTPLRVFVSLIFSTFIFVRSSPEELPLAFFPAAGHLNPAEYPLLLTCPKLRFRFLLWQPKKETHSAHFVFSTDALGRRVA